MDRDLIDLIIANLDIKMNILILPLVIVAQKLRELWHEV